MIADQLATAAGRPINRAEREGLRVYWTDTGGAFRAMLAFRVGFADEPLPLRGISHLVEHLAISPKRRLYQFNGWAGIATTGFWAEGRPEEALETSRMCAGCSRRPVASATPVAGPRSTRTGGNRTGAGGMKPATRARRSGSAREAAPGRPWRARAEGRPAAGRKGSARRSRPRSGAAPSLTVSSSTWFSANSSAAAAP